jgi:hypothetical protein
MRLDEKRQPGEATLYRVDAVLAAAMAAGRRRL